MISLAKIVLSDKTETKNMPFFDKTETNKHPFLDKTKTNKSLFPYSPKNPLLYLLTFNFFTGSLCTDGQRILGFNFPIKRPCLFNVFCCGRKTSWRSTWFN